MFYFLVTRLRIRLAVRRKVSGAEKLPSANIDESSYWSRLDWFSFATIAARVDAFTTPANFMVERICRCNLRLSGKAHIIPTGVNATMTAAMRQAKRQPATVVKFASICRLQPEKRVDVIIKAFIAANLPGSELHIAGSGDQEMSLKRLAQNSPNIIFHGHLSQIEDVANFYAQSGVFVLASYGFDTQAMTIGEAVRAGLPVIYCDPRLTVGTDGGNSILTTSPDIEAFATAMQQLTDDTLRQTLAAASHRLAPRLSPKRMAEQYVDAYCKIGH